MCAKIITIEERGGDEERLNENCQKVYTSEVGWRVTFKVVDTLTVRPQMAGRPFEELPHELCRK